MVVRRVGSDLLQDLFFVLGGEFSLASFDHALQVLSHNRLQSGCAGTIKTGLSHRKWPHVITSGATLFRELFRHGADWLSVQYSSPWRIRPYQPEDADACRTCIVELQDVEREIDPRLRPGDSMADEYLQQMHMRCRGYAGAILVAEHAESIAGLVMVLTRVPFELDEPPGDYALVAELVVRAGHRGLGIGRALLQAAERFARESGATELRIGVLSDNSVARQLYLAEGFAPYVETLAKGLTSPATASFAPPDPFPPDAESDQPLRLTALS